MNADARSSAVPAEMRALVCHGVRDYRLETRPVPVPGPGELLVKVKHCGICASDIKCHGGAPLFWGDEFRAPYVEPPVIPGHEFTGVVVGLGEGAGELHGVAAGNRVVAEQIVPCNDCLYCRRGQYWLCVKARIYGFKRSAQGGMAEYMIFPRNSRVYRVPAGISDAHAALIEPLACAIHAVERGNIKLGDVVVQVGCGTLGLCMIAAERLKNPGLLIALDLIDSRLRLAKEFGADLVFNPTRTDGVEEVLDLTDGYGCDVLVEATGNPQAIEPSLHMIQKAGTFVEFSVMKGLSTVDWTIIGDGKELDIHGAHLGPYAFPVSIEYLLRGLVSIEPIVTDELPLEEYEAGFAAVEHPETSIKVLLKP